MTGSSSPTEFDGEGQFTSAIHFVTSEESKQIYYTSGHGEQSFSASVLELMEKNNIEEKELNLLMTNEIPQDCDLLMLYAPTADISEDEKDLILSYMSEGGKVFVILGEMKGDAPNLDALLNEYGIQRVDGYIADMVLLVNAHGLTVGDAERDTINVSEFMTTSSQAYAVTEETQEEGIYTLGVVATETISSGEDEEDTEEAEMTEETEVAE